MKIKLPSKNHNILILGAGASVDYGLPVWKALAPMIIEKISSDSAQKYQYAKEILNWLSKVGEGNKYATVDECIEKESDSPEYHANGAEIENELFTVMKDIFVEIHKTNNEGWINKLNQKILLNEQTNWQDRIAFINYNYDPILEQNFLNFSYLSQKRRDLKHRERLQDLVETRVTALYPHGNFFSPYELGYTHIDRHMDTMKSHSGSYVDAVSCYESRRHSVELFNTSVGLNLYILGLGSGLQINLNNIDFVNPISHIHITIRDEKMVNEVVAFLAEKFQIPESEISIYNSCETIIDACFHE